MNDDRLLSAAVPTVGAKGAVGASLWCSGQRCRATLDFSTAWRRPPTTPSFSWCAQTPSSCRRSRSSLPRPRSVGIFATVSNTPSFLHKLRSPLATRCVILSCHVIEIEVIPAMAKVSLNFVSWVWFVRVSNTQSFLHKLHRPLTTYYVILSCHGFEFHVHVL